MKTIVKYILVLASVLVSITSCGSVNFNRNALEGNGVMVMKNIPCPEFTSVYAARCVRVVLVDEPADTITVRADENVMPYVLLTCESGRLTATIDPAINSVSDCTVEVTVSKNDRIGKLHASSAARIRADRLVTAEELDIEVSSAARIRGDFAAKSLSFDVSSAGKIEGSAKCIEAELEGSSAGKIELNLEATEVSVDLSSAAKITLCGTAAACEVDASSSGKMDGREFRVERAQIETSSGARCDICCSRQFEAKASSGSSVRNHCRPEHARVKSTSGGSIDSGC